MFEDSLGCLTLSGMTSSGCLMCLSILILTCLVSHAAERKSVRDKKRDDKIQFVTLPLTQAHKRNAQGIYFEGNILFSLFRRD